MTVLSKPENSEIIEFLYIAQRVFPCFRLRGAGKEDLVGYYYECARLSPLIGFSQG